MRYEITASARKHGIAPDDMVHAVDYPMAVVPGMRDTALYIGAARSGALLEVGVTVADVPRIIHAMPLRQTLYRYLRRSGD